MVEVTLVVLRVVLFLALALVSASNILRTPYAKHPGTRRITAGFILLALGSVFDAIAASASLEEPTAGEPIASLTALATLIGYLPGTLLMLWGLHSLLKLFVRLERAELELNEREGHYRNIISNMPSAAYRMLAQSNWSSDFFSPQIRDIAGYSARELIHKEHAFVDIIHPDDRQHVLDTFEKHLKTDKNYELHYRLLHANGEVRTVFDRGRARFDTHHQRHCLEGVILDITALREAQRKLLIGEERYRSIVQDQEEFVVRWLPDGTRTFVNDRFCRYFDCTPEQVIGTSFLDTLSPADRLHIETRARQLTPGNPVTTDIHRLVSSDGETRWQHWTDRAIFDENGVLSEFQSIGRDVTAEKFMEEALKKSEERYRAFIMNSNEGIFRVDFEDPISPDIPLAQQAQQVVQRGMITEANEAFAQIHGKTAAQVVGMPLGVVIPGVLASVNEFVAHNYRLTDNEAEVKTADGQFIWTAFSAVGQKKNGYLSHVWGTQRNITERKQHDALIYNISRGVSAQTGENFFRSLIRHLSQALEADYAFIAETSTEDPSQLKTIAIFQHDQQIANQTYTLAGSPSERIIAQGLFICPAQVQTNFPNDHKLQELSVQAYVGSALNDTAGRALGVLAVLYKHPTQVSEKIASLLQIFASRASAELERRQSQMAIAESEERYRAFIANSFNGIVRFDISPPVSLDTDLEQQKQHIMQRAFIAECNDQAAKTRGFDTGEQIIGHTLTDYAAAPLVEAGLARFIQADYRLEKMEVRTRRQDQQEIWLEINAVGYVEDNKLIRIWSTHIDITERKNYLAELEHRASHDSLTDLPNREFLYKKIAKQIRRAAGKPCALMLMDLNHFKEINDTLGHHSGDVLLKKIAPRLHPLLTNTNSLLARLGGDEFAILTPDSAEVDVEALAEQVLQALKRAFNIEGLQVEISASIGITYYPEHGADASTLMRCADVAMYVAKDEASGFRIYNTGLDIHSPQRLTLMTELGQAIRSDQMQLYYQAKVDIKSQSIQGFEALLRWVHPSHGLILPAQFVPLAELGDLIRPLTQWVMSHGIEQCRRWQDQGFHTRVALNLSTRNLLDERCADELEILLKEYDVSPQAIEMEITESALMKDPERALHILNRIHDLGVSLAIDDFGTGYSSLNYLRRLPIQTLKIDLSLVRTMIDNPQDAIIVKSIIDLAESLNLKVIAEGVENPTTLHTLEQMGCNYAQGYYISEPLPQQAIMSWQQESNWAVGI